MTAPDLLSRIDAAIGLRPELADLLNECRAEIVRLSEAAAAPVVDDGTAGLVARTADLPLDALLALWRPGSGDWSWQEESDRLWADDAPRMDMLASSIQVDGIRVPVVLAYDGDCWDGHHRICVAMALGLELVPVEFVPKSLSISAPAAPVVDVTALAEGVIAASSALPEWRPVEFALDPGEPGDDESLIWGVTASWRGPGDAWALTRGCYMHGGQTCFNRDGGIAWEERGADAEWRAQHRFTLEEALELGKKFLPKIVVNGETWAQVVAWRTGGRQRDENGRPIIPSDGA